MSLRGGGPWRHCRRCTPQKLFWSNRRAWQLAKPAWNSREGSVCIHRASMCTANGGERSHLVFGPTPVDARFFRPTQRQQQPAAWWGCESIAPSLPNGGGKTDCIAECAASGRDHDGTSRVTPQSRNCVKSWSICPMFLVVPPCIQGNIRRPNSHNWREVFLHIAATAPLEGASS